MPWLYRPGRVVASPESARYLRASGVPEHQLIVVTGGETVDCGHDVRVRIVPALHSCLFASSDSDSGVACIGDVGMSAQDRAAKVAELFGMMSQAPPPAGAALMRMLDTTSAHDGGQLAFLLANASGSILVSGSAGYWRGLYTDLRPDVALLSLAGRPNVDGEPFQGSGAEFVVEQVKLLGARSVALCHHDPLFPGVPGVDIRAAAALVREEAPSIDYFGLCSTHDLLQNAQFTKEHGEHTARSMAFNRHRCRCEESYPSLPILPPSNGTVPAAVTSDLIAPCPTMDLCGGSLQS
jgi:L-ascorbate metabolism protein UlaG (beta-lactamase superfamily)